jgi:hypothetical protein
LAINVYFNNTEGLISDPPYSPYFIRGWNMQVFSQKKYIKVIAYVCFLSLSIAVKINPYSMRMHSNKMLMKSWGRNKLISLVPFTTIQDYIKNYTHYAPSILYRFFFGNILFLVPMGILLGIWKVKQKNAHTIIIMTSIVQEIISFVFYSPFDIDSVILNICGCFIAYYCTKAILRKKEEKNQNYR